MNRPLLVSLAFVALSLVISCGHSTEARVRTYFAISPSTSIDSVTVKAAVLRLLPLGTPEPEAVRRLGQRGIGHDGMTTYIPPDSRGFALVEINHDPRSIDLIKRTFAIGLWFGTRGLDSIEVHDWLTGP